MKNIGLKITNNVKHFSETPSIESSHTPREKAKLAKAAKEFESMLTSMMLKSMNKTSGGMFGENSFGGDYFDTIFETELGAFIGKSKSLGVADMIYKKIIGEDLNLAKIKREMKDEGIGSLEPKIKSENVSNINRNFVNNSDPIFPSKGSIDRLKKYDNIISSASERYGVDEGLIRSVILAESAAKYKAISHANAKGLMQLIDSTASDMKVKNVWNPRDNIFGGTKYLSKMLKKFDGDLKLSLAAYNAGPGNVQKFDGVPPFEETKNYINRVKGYMKYWEIN